jgi:hypothetical protein
MTDYGTPLPPPDPENQGRWLADVIRSVQLPGVVLQWYGVVSFVLAATVLAIFLAAPDQVADWYYQRMVQQQREVPAEERTPLPPRDKFAKQMQIQWAASGAVNMVTGFLTAFGGIRMKQLHGYGWAVTGSLLAAIPCTSMCCCIGLPIGLYALVTLFGSDVRMGFSRVGAAGGLEAFQSEFRSRDDDPPSRPIRLE